MSGKEEIILEGLFSYKPLLLKIVYIVFAIQSLVSFAFIAFYYIVTTFVDSEFAFAVPISVTIQKLTMSFIICMLSSKLVKLQRLVLKEE